MKKYKKYLNEKMKKKKITTKKLIQLNLYEPAFIVC